MAYKENRDNDKLISTDSWGNEIKNYGDKVTIKGNNGNDNIWNLGSNVSIFGGVGKDTFYSNPEGNYISIDGGADNDSIRNFAINSKISGGDGDDRIGNYVRAYLDGKLVSETSGKNVTISSGNGND